MSFRLAMGAATAVILFCSIAFAEVIEVPAQPLYTLEYQWLNLVFTPLDTSQSDTVWATRQGNTYLIRIRFYRLPLPTPTGDCQAFYMRATATFLGGYPQTGLRFQIFPQDSGEADSFRFYPNTYWGQLYTYHECPIGVPVVHQVPWPPGDEDYMAWLLNHDRPHATDLIVGLMTENGDTHILHSFSLFWDTGTDAGDPPVAGLFAVSPCYPNPFNAATGFDVTLPHESKLTVTVFDVLGRRIAVLSDGWQTAGQQRFSWQPDALAGGFYFITVSTPATSQVLRATYLK